MADMFSSNWTLAPRGASGLLRPPLVRLLLLPPLGLALLVEDVDPVLVGETTDAMTEALRV